jgi:predicted ArsR family transcriptional regulator
MNIFQSDIFKVNLATNQVPSFKVDKNLGIVKQGKKDDYSNYLLFLMNNHAEHGAIVRGKANYVTGISINPKDKNDLSATEFLKRANPFESFYELSIKTDLDDACFGGHYEMIESNIEGVPLNWYHIPYNSVRVCEGGESFRVCDDWSDRLKVVNAKTYPKYKEGFSGTSIRYIKRYTPSKDKVSGTYAIPEYTPCILDIDTDIRVGTFFNNYIKNNFSSGTMVTIFNGETDPTKKQNIVDRFKQEHTSEDEAGKPVIVFAPKDGKGAEIASLNASDLDKQYQEVSKRNKEKIVAGHGVPAQLFKVKVDDKALFSRNELVEAHELFINEYVRFKQEEKLNRYAKDYKLKTGKETEFEIEQIKNIGLELPLDNQTVVTALNAKNPNIITDYIIEKYGIKVPEGSNNITPQQPAQTVQPVQQETNDSLRGLSASENADLYRIVRDYSKGKLNEHLALARVKAYGINDEQAKKILGIETNLSEDKTGLFFSLMDKYAKDVNENDEVLERVQYNGHKTNFADALTVTITELRNAILNQIKGNPFLSVYDLSKNFNISEDQVKEQLSWLEDKKLIDTSEGSFTPTEKAIGRETEPIETEIYTEYTYGLRDDLPARAATGESNSNLEISTTRDFCKKMINQYAKKAVDYSELENLNNDFGDNAFDYRGGYYNDGTQTTPWCRHVWVMETKLRTKKK